MRTVSQSILLLCLPFCLIICLLFFCERTDGPPLLSLPSFLSFPFPSLRDFQTPFFPSFVVVFLGLVLAKCAILMIFVDQDNLKNKKRNNEKRGMNWIEFTIVYSKKIKIAKHAKSTKRYKRARVYEREKKIWN